MSTLPGQALIADPPYPHGTLDWQAQALCRRTTPDLLQAFFPGRGKRHDTAKDICSVCEVTAECLAFAIANDEMHGIWGGKNPRERRKLAELKAVS
ncbi:MULTISPECIES: WhiB family transcriptional regulator [Mycobacterium]|uniref:WhiB family transcriptional regulator n=1 Tax=Mycobacterium TaxID=1763 RepID=UPI0007C77810|nr:MULTISPECIES: WhiB family transcriptional regulator [Mycobacterium]MDP7732125.1 WhiB family transcriptional regulator [Mycobacterium sp. TY813]